LLKGKLFEFIHQGGNLVRLQSARTIFEEFNNIFIVDQEYRDYYYELIEVIILPSILDETLSLLKVETLSKEDILELHDFLTDPLVKKSYFDFIDEENRGKADFIQLLMDVYQADPSFFLESSSYYPKNLNDKHQAALFQSLLQMMMADQVKPELFRKILFTFIHLDPVFDRYIQHNQTIAKEDVNERLTRTIEKYNRAADGWEESSNFDSPRKRKSSYRLLEAITYIHNHAAARNKAADISYEFIKWICKDADVVFQTAEKRAMKPEAKDALERYFSEIYPEALSDKKVMKSFFELDYPGLTKLLKALQKQNANAMMKVMFDVGDAIKSVPQVFRRSKKDEKRTL